MSPCRRAAAAIAHSLLKSYIKLQEFDIISVLFPDLTQLGKIGKLHSRVTVTTETSSGALPLPNICRSLLLCGFSEAEFSFLIPLPKELSPPHPSALLKRKAASYTTAKSFSYVSDFVTALFACGPHQNKHLQRTLHPTCSHLCKSALTLCVL